MIQKADAATIAIIHLPQYSHQSSYELKSICSNAGNEQILGVKVWTIWIIPKSMRDVFSD